MAKSIALAADPSRLASLLLSYIQAVCAFVAPRQPGASAAIIDRLSHSRALRVRVRTPRASENRALGSGRAPNKSCLSRLRYKFGDRCTKLLVACARELV